MATAQGWFEDLDQPTLDGLTLDYTIFLLGVWSMTGVVLDIRKHGEGFNFSEEGFVTPEHAMFYTGFLGVLTVLFTATYLRRTRGGLSWHAAIPSGYEVCALGILLFTFGGPGDALWHSLYGAEGGVEALVSPTHLLLASGGALMVSSPVRSAWRREMTSSWRSSLPMVFSVGAFLILPTSFTMYANPFMIDAGMDTTEAAVGIGLGSFIVHAAIITAVTVSVVRRFDLPTGSFTMIFAIVGVSMAALVDLEIAALTYDGVYLAALPYLAAGLVADGLALSMDAPSPRVTRLRLFGVAVPVVWAATYFAVIGTVSSLVWTVHVWTGAIALSFITGIAITYVAIPSVHSPETEGSTDAV